MITHHNSKPGFTNITSADPNVYDAQGMSAAQLENLSRAKGCPICAVNTSRDTRAVLSMGSGVTVIKTANGFRYVRPDWEVNCEF